MIIKGIYYARSPEYNLLGDDNSTYIVNPQKMYMAAMQSMMMIEEEVVQPFFNQSSHLLKTISTFIIL